jgi:hypothetical protein
LTSSIPRTIPIGLSSSRWKLASPLVGWAGRCSATSSRTPSTTTAVMPLPETLTRSLPSRTVARSRRPLSRITVAR